MPNVLALNFNDALKQIIVLIDGQELFSLDPNHLEDTFLHPPGPAHWDVDPYRKSDHDRVVCSNFCMEYCCPSVFAIVTSSTGKVNWTDIGERTHSHQPHGKAYEFDQTQYEGEIAQMLKLVSEKGY